MLWSDKLGPGRTNHTTKRLRMQSPLLLEWVVWDPCPHVENVQIRSKQMTKKAIKDLPNKGTKDSELKPEDLDKVSGGLSVIGGIATKIASFVNVA